MGRTGLRYDVRYVLLSREIHDGARLANPNGEYASHLTSQLSLALHPWKDIAFSIILPYTDRTQNTFADDGSGLVHNENHGLGDMTAIGRYILLNDHKFADTRMLSLNAGVKFPTGSTSARDANGDLLEPDYQLGTGSWNTLLGTSFLLGFENFSIASNMTYAITGHGANNHTYGNNLNYDLTGRYRVYPDDAEDFSIFGTLGITGEARGHEILNGAIDPNSGGDVTYIAPGIQIFFMPGLSFEASYHFAVINALDGDQLGERYRIMSGVQWMF